MTALALRPLHFAMDRTKPVFYYRFCAFKWLTPCLLPHCGFPDRHRFYGYYWCSVNGYEIVVGSSWGLLCFRKRLRGWERVWPRLLVWRPNSLQFFSKVVCFATSTFRSRSTVKSYKLFAAKFTQNTIILCGDEKLCFSIRESYPIVVSVKSRRMCVLRRLYRSDSTRGDFRRKLNNTLFRRHSSERPDGRRRLTRDVPNR